MTTNPKYIHGTREWYKRSADDRYFDQINAGVCVNEAEKEYDTYLRHKFQIGDVIVPRTWPSLALQSKPHVVVATAPMSRCTWGMVVRLLDGDLLGVPVHVDPDRCEWYVVCDMVKAASERNKS